MALKCGIIAEVTLTLLALPSLGVSRFSGPSVAAEFLVSPANRTVPEGAATVMKCKLASEVTTCRWFYLGSGLDFFSGLARPIFVKEFSPLQNNRDCSIKFTRVKKNQEGQWLCQALKFLSSDFLTAKPVFLRVVTEEEILEAGNQLTSTTAATSTTEADPIQRNVVEEEEVSAEERPKIWTSEKYNIRDTHLRENVSMSCQVGNPLSDCLWIMPHGEILPSQAVSSESYEVGGNFEDGLCELQINGVQMQDEGNWRCLISIMPARKQVRGPLIHLHIQDVYPTQIPGGRGDFLHHNSRGIIIILSVAIISLIVVFSVLTLCLYSRIKRKSTHQSIPASVKPHCQNNLSEKDPKSNLYQYLTDMQHYQHYLDMSGSDTTSTGYLIMPTKPNDQRTGAAMEILRNSEPLSACDSSSCNSSDTTLTFDNPSYRCEPTPMGNPTNRPVSVYSTGHLYEEIDDSEERTRSSHIYINEDEAASFSETAQAGNQDGAKDLLTSSSYVPVLYDVPSPPKEAK